MAYAKKNQTFKAYVQVPLMPEMAEEIATFVTDDTGLIAAIEALLMQGFVLKMSYSPDDDAYSVACIQSNPLSSDEGYGYYSGGATVQEAIAAAYVKNHFLVSAKKSLQEQALAGRPKLY